MVRQSLLTALMVSLTFYLSPADCWGRGFGGGARGGGLGGGGFGGAGGHGGGFGGAGHSPGGFGGGGSGGGGAGHSLGGFGGGGFGGGAGHTPGGFGAGGFGGGEAGHSPGGFGGGQRGGAGFGGGQPGGAGAGGPGPAGGAGFGGPRSGAGGFGQGGPSAFGNRGPGSQGPGGDRFSSPSSGQLSSFLGMPSDGGLHHLGSAGTGPGNVGVGGDLGVGGGRPGAGVGGVGGIGVGGDLGIGGGRPGAGAGGVGRPGAGVGGVGRPGVGAGGVGRPGVGVGGVGRPGVGAGGVGRPGVGAGGVGGFTPVSASARYTTATAVRTNYNHWDVYGRDWYARYPGAWFAGGWAAGAAWRACTWNSAASYCGYYQATPLYYDYGNTVTYQDNSVYVNGDNVGTTQQYYDQASNLASTGATAEAPSDGDWLPLGVFALTKPDQKKSDVTIQLAVNKQGILRGNYTDTVTNKNQVVQGSVDKKTQRAAFTVGDNTTNIIETGLYNLTKDEAPCLLHFGSDRTEQWLLVRLENPKTSSGQTTNN